MLSLNLALKDIGSRPITTYFVASVGDKSQSSTDLVGLTCFSSAKLSTKTQAIKDSGPSECQVQRGTVRLEEAQEAAVALEDRYNPIPTMMQKRNEEASKCRKLFP